MTPATPQFAELQAPAHWRVVEFISDLHLQITEPETLREWERYMAQTRADAIFILGDLFEVWVGDDGPGADDKDGRFEQNGIGVLRGASGRCAVHLMHGNRDFLFGHDSARAAGLSLLQDPTTLVFGGQRWLLTHGDALCLDDIEYLQFRAEVRNEAWQRAFLSRPLAERRAIARGLRQESEDRKRSGAAYADVDAPLARQWLQTAGARELIHGHTHKPADHDLGTGLSRRVLSDWDATAHPPRSEVLRLSLSAPGEPVRVRRLAARDIA
jgi:UDP-2,3-diacylglucosamine hydrolase